MLAARELFCDKDMYRRTTTSFFWAKVFDPVDRFTPVVQCCMINYCSSIMKYCSLFLCVCYFLVVYCLDPEESPPFFSQGIPSLSLSKLM